MGEQQFQLGQLDVTTLLHSVSRLGADVFLPTFVGEEQLSLLRSFGQQGLRRRMTLGTLSFDEQMASRMTASERVGFIVCTPYAMSLDNSRNLDFIDRFVEGPGIQGIWPQGDGIARSQAVGAYSCVAAFAKAVRRAGDVDTAPVAAALAHVEIMGPQGPVRMDPETQSVATQSYLCESTGSGELSVIETFAEPPLRPERYPADTADGHSERITAVSALANVAGEVESLYRSDAQFMPGDFSAALDAVDVALVAVNDQGLILSINGVTEDIFGYEKAEIVGQHISVLVPPRFRGAHTKHMSGFVGGGESAVLMSERREILGYTKQGGEFSAEASIVKVGAAPNQHHVAMLRRIASPTAGHGPLARDHGVDPLTRLPNRATFVDRLTNSLDRSMRSGGSVGLLFIDVDEFKLVNDSYGHATGDRLLVDIAERLLSTVRGGDTVARLGGDEFVVLCERLSDETSIAFLAERLLARLRESFQVDSMDLLTSVSVGVAASRDGGTSGKELLGNADTAMYRAKEEGRNRWVVFSPELHEAASRRMTLAAGLRVAIENEELGCKFQPIVATDSGQTVGVEVLMRWNPSMGPVAPTEFIPVAEINGTIEELSEWTFKRACLTQVAIAGLGTGIDPYVSVNISARQLDHADLAQRLARICSELGADPTKFMLELTESAFRADAEASIKTLKELTEEGFRMALDNFGSGISSLDRLSKMPLHALKVDRSFVRRMVDSDLDMKLTESIVQMAHALNLDVVAEGVETREELRAVREIGADACQGFLLAHPRSFDDLMDWLGSPPSV